MKKSLLLALVSVGAFAQKNIVDIKLDKQTPAVGFDYDYKNDRLMIEQASKALAAVTFYNKAVSYDAEGVGKNAVDGDFLMLYFSGGGPAIKSINQTSAFSSSSAAFYTSDGQVFRKEKAKSAVEISDPECFDDNFQYWFGDKDGKQHKVDFEKDGIFLTKYNFRTQQKSAVPIEKPATARYHQGVKIKHIPAILDMTSPGQLDMITKTIGPDDKVPTKSTLYRTIYGTDGIMLHEYAYSFELGEGALFALPYTEDMDYFTEVGYTWSMEPNHGPVADYDYTSHYIDPKNHDVYIYGLYVANDGPIGVYAVRFRENGEKVWQQSYPINDPKGFSRKRQYGMDVTLMAAASQIYMSVSGEYSMTDHYNHFLSIDKETGKISKKGDLESEVYTRKGTFTIKGGKGSMFFNESVEKGKYSSVATFMAMAFNDKVKNYIKSVRSKNDVYFDAYFTDKGIWLMESDNKEYFKATLFE